MSTRKHATKQAKARDKARESTRQSTRRHAQFRRQRLWRRTLFKLPCANVFLKYVFCPMFSIIVDLVLRIYYHTHAPPPPLQPHHHHTTTITNYNDFDYGCRCDYERFGLHCLECLECAFPYTDGRLRQVLGPAAAASDVAMLVGAVIDAEVKIKEKKQRQMERECVWVEGASLARGLLVGIVGKNSQAHTCSCSVFTTSHQPTPRACLTPTPRLPQGGSDQRCGQGTWRFPVARSGRRRRRRGGGGRGAPHRPAVSANRGERG